MAIKYAKCDKDGGCANNPVHIFFTKQMNPANIQLPKLFICK